MDNISKSEQQKNGSKAETDRHASERRQSIYETFTKHSYTHKLSYIKSNIRFIDIYCGWYAQLLDSYIKDAKEDYGPFIQTFDTIEIDHMVRTLSKSPKDTYNAVVISWLTHALKLAKEKEENNLEIDTHESEELKRMQRFYEDFTKNSSTQKLNYLKSHIQFMDTKLYCGWYAQLLHNYITDAKTDCEPFIQTFDTAEIDSMLKALSPNQCPRNTYDPVVSSWLTKANFHLAKKQQEEKRKRKKKFKHWPKSRDDLCKLNKLIGGSTVNINYSHGGTKSNHVEDIAGIFTHESDAVHIKDCLNELNESGSHTIVEPFKVVRYKIGTIINGLSQYNPDVDQTDNIYIVYRIIKYKSDIRNIFFLGINFPTDYAKVKKYKLNTVIPFVNVELYYNTLKKRNIKISYLDDLGIKYTAWDNYDNTAGTCMWHAFSKALDMSIPEIAERIKYTFGESTKELYNRLINYKTMKSESPITFCEMIPILTKGTGLVVFNDDLIKKSDHHADWYSGNAVCYFPKHPKKVIFIAMTYTTGVHAVVLTLNGKTLDDNWSENIDDVKDELLRILPKNCHEMLT